MLKQVIAVILMTVAVASTAQADTFRIKLEDLKQTHHLREVALQEYKQERADEKATKELAEAKYEAAYDKARVLADADMASASDALTDRSNNRVLTGLMAGYGLYFVALVATGGTGVPFIGLVIGAGIAGIVDAVDTNNTLHNITLEHMNATDT